MWRVWTLSCSSCSIWFINMTPCVLPPITTRWQHNMGCVATSHTLRSRNHHNRTHKEEQDAHLTTPPHNTTSEPPDGLGPCHCFCMRVYCGLDHRRDFKANRYQSTPPRAQQHAFCAWHSSRDLCGWRYHSPHIWERCLSRHEVGEYSWHKTVANIHRQCWLVQHKGKNSSSASKLS